MPSPCSYGAEKKPEAPDYFTWVPEIIDTITDVAGGWKTWLGKYWGFTSLGMAQGPINTQKFCEDFESGEEWRGAEDWAVSVLTPRFLSSGANVRLAQSIKQHKFYEVCQCKVPPVPPPAANQVCGTGSPAGYRICWVGAPIDANTCRLTVYCVDKTPVLGPTTGQPMDPRAMIVWNAVPEVGAAPNLYPNSTSTGALNVGQTGYLMDLTTSARAARGTIYPCVWTNDPAEPDMCATLRWDQFGCAEGTHDATRLVEPTNYPANPACPTINTLQDLGDMLCSVLDSVKSLGAGELAIMNMLAAPTAFPEDQPTPVQPNTPIHKPGTAVGVVVELVDVPPWIARRGSPTYFADVGHLFMQTSNGPLRSIAIAHNPQVVLFPHPLVTDVRLDMSPGVLAQVRFLMPPE